MKRLGQKPEQLEEYDRAIKDQLDKGIIERFHQSEKVQPCHPIHYLPHNCVVSEDKSTNKLRIVYNALVRENGPDCLHTWPPLTPDIPEILIRFRVQPIALVADIKRAFLMTTVKEEDREVLRFCGWMMWIQRNLRSLNTDLLESCLEWLPVPFFWMQLSSGTSIATKGKNLNLWISCFALYVDDLSLSLEDVDEAYQLSSRETEWLEGDLICENGWPTQGP